MSQPSPIGLSPAASPDPRAAIARAAQATGVDFSYLLAQARIESSLDPSARAPTSSAAGLYQFTQGTWLSTLRRHGAEHGLGWAQDAVVSGATRDPAMRAQVMALRFDPQASALMAAELANDNRTDLSARLGREPDAAELYLAHFLGSAGAGQFLDALAANPLQSAAALMPQAAAANRTIFHERDGSPRSVAGMMDLIRAKVAGAMAREGDTPAFTESPAIVSAAPTPSTQGPIARQFHALAAQTPRRSMADTLRETFGTDAHGSGTAPRFVRTAYARLQQFGL
ncbi:MAG: lytic transglycosylase domain-containing protein [Novosphingobium sp.]|nr:lytic transglycosylase domain-containing protein [Novosphingobium sp.]